MISAQQVCSISHSHGQVKVTDCGCQTKKILGLMPTTADEPPQVSNTVRQEHISNRLHVYEGELISFDQYGRVAIVRDPHGVEAAFFGSELSASAEIGL